MRKTGGSQALSAGGSLDRSCRDLGGGDDDDEGEDDEDAGDDDDDEVVEDDDEAYDEDAGVKGRSQIIKMEI